MKRGIQKHLPLTEKTQQTQNIFSIPPPTPYSSALPPCFPSGWCLVFSWPHATEPLHEESNWEAQGKRTLQTPGHYSLKTYSEMYIILIRKSLRQQRISQLSLNVFPNCKCAFIDHFHTHFQCQMCTWRCALRRRILGNFQKFAQMYEITPAFKGKLMRDGARVGSTFPKEQHTAAVRQKLHELP